MNPKTYPKMMMFLIIVVSFSALGIMDRVFAAQDHSVLAKVVFSRWQELGDLPVYALLQDRQGIDYALVIAPLYRLEQSCLDYEILDPDASQAVYWLAHARQPAAAPPLAGRWLYYDGLTWLIRFGGEQPSISQAWRSAGYELQPLPDEPLTIRSERSTLVVDDYNPAIADMISQVDASTIYSLTAQLSGEWQAVVGGSPYTFTSRNTKNITAIQNATQYAFEYMQTRHLSPVYQNWSGCPSGSSPASRNVIGELPGDILASQIVLITAHIDDLPEAGLAPGADDNASGSVAVLIAADILSQYEFERTVRFILFSGEEQGLCGSKAYAVQADARKENIVAVLNLDMIAWDNKDGPAVSLHTRQSSHPSYQQDLAIANTFIHVVDHYGLDSVLIPSIVADGKQYSDHASFWNKGFPALFAIEDDHDFNPNWHTANDTLASLNLTYYMNFVRAVVGTSATLALQRMEEKVFFPLVASSAAE